MLYCIINIEKASLDLNCRKLYVNMLNIIFTPLNFSSCSAIDWLDSLSFFICRQSWRSCRHCSRVWCCFALFFSRACHMVVGCIFQENLEGVVEVACMILVYFTYIHFLAPKQILSSMVYQGSAFLIACKCNLYSAQCLTTQRHFSCSWNYVHTILSSANLGEKKIK